ncbi:Protein with methyl-accepting chemotaxis protein (MCP) signaling domain [Desulfatibacillum aliphaticivorans]|uniref:Protein with methyl-accepting chemotaxis protein (MCP) signaling domain n=1 Tax=Desulfatibacillum aliphaticivorans TaxID=218208 RepID=B8F992_DESAL|nr:methyl-accepting chemotaxis protein [Desulfatibacillum aliphaticivorans]ACL02838.1 Protein with methyl-accepting chemotaxis protein (MCP) signaling domain [Desulfatibacillum aliphaticivorans]
MFKKVKLGTKIFGAVIPIMVLLCLVAGFAYNGFQKVADRVEKGDDVNRLVKIFLETRRQEKNYMLRGEEEYLNSVRKNVSDITALAEASKKKFQSDASKKQIDEVIASAAEYAQAFEAYAASVVQRNQALERIDALAESAIQEAKDIGEEQKGQLERIRSRSKQLVAETQWSAEAAGEVIYMIFDARGAEKSYQLTSFDKYADKVQESGVQINRLLSSIEKKIDKEPGKTLIQEALAASQAYFEGFAKIVEMTKNYEYSQAAEVREEASAQADLLVQKVEALTENQKVVLNEIRDEAEAQTKDKIEKADSSRKLVQWFLEARLAEKAFVNSQGGLVHLDAVNARIGSILSLGEDLENRFTQQRNQERIGAVMDAVRAYVGEFGAIASMMEEQLMAESVMVESAREAIKVCAAAREEQKTKMLDVMSSTTRNMILAALGAVILGLFLALTITRSITKPIHAVISGLNEGSEQVASASQQVSSSSQSLAEGASQQAATLEETSSSLEEMASMTKQNAENAGQADNLMKETFLVVEKAGGSMSQLTQSIADIAQASAETSKIIKTIDEIAFQTNLLALNAAVEAARAGEAGAGFAVVADEVRNLATRAAEAAHNTSFLIDATMEKVTQGTDLVEKTNEAFGEVGASASRVEGLVAEIAEASREQSQGIEQVNNGVTDMDKVTQQNAANAEESASASEELNAQAEQLQSMVEQLSKIVGGKAKGKKTETPKPQPKLAARKAKSLTDKASSRGRIVDPEQVIPMDDEDFTDF